MDIRESKRGRVRIKRDAFASNYNRSNCMNSSEKLYRVDGTNAVKYEICGS